MQTRRDLLKLAAMASGVAGISGLIPESIQRAYAIEPAAGSTYLDAEHIVILMQENRSFDHAFGALRGVRGFNDPRALRLATRFSCRPTLRATPMVPGGWTSVTPGSRGWDRFPIPAIARSMPGTKVAMMHGSRPSVQGLRSIPTFL
jgi:hypothetical protein